MKKQMFVVAALLTLTCLVPQTSSAQSPGGRKTTKVSKLKTTPTPAPTESARPRAGTPAAASPQASAKDNASGFKEVSKEKFKEIYFRLGGGKRSGWTADYWQKFFENDAKPGWKFMIEEPKSARHVRMNIVTDFKAKEYRLFFMTEEDEDPSN